MFIQKLSDELFLNNHFCRTGGWDCLINEKHGTLWRRLCWLRDSLIIYLSLINSSYKSNDVILILQEKSPFHLFRLCREVRGHSRGPWGLYKCWLSADTGDYIQVFHRICAIVCYVLIVSPDPVFYWFCFYCDPTLFITIVLEALGSHYNMSLAKRYSPAT